MVREFMQHAIGQTMGEQTDLVIAAALNDACPGWTMESLKDRLLQVSRKGDEGSVFYLDGKPLLWMGPIKSEIKDGFINTTRDFKHLWGKEERPIAGASIESRRVSGSS